MLLGEHLGRREQRSLPARVDHLEHRAQGDQRLAGPDLSLEQAVHRVLGGKLGGDLLTHRRLALGQRERQPLVERREQAAATGPGLPPERGQRRPTTGHHELGHQRLVEAEPALRLLYLGP